MVTLQKLLGARSEVHFECMYTKHKTQKRKVWHDGFVSLFASHKLVLYEEMPPEGRVLDEAKMTQFEWERRDEEFINVPKFLVEIINDTPVSLAATDVGGGTSASTQPKPNPPPRTEPRAVGGNKFKSPVAGGSGNQALPRPGAAAARQPLGRYATPPQRPPPETNKKIAFDFDRHPTSEWSYAQDAPARSAADVAALFNASRQQRS